MSRYLFADDSLAGGGTGLVEGEGRAGAVPLMRRRGRTRILHRNGAWGHGEVRLRQGEDRVRSG